MIRQVGETRPDTSGSRRRERGQVNWDTVAIDYGYAEMTIGAICRKHAITRAELLQRAKAHRWPTQRTQSTDRGLLIGMMLDLLEVQLEHLEKAEMTATGEKEVVVLGKLAGTLDKLIDIENRSRVSPTAGENMQEIRNKLAQRIENLQRK